MNVLMDGRMLHDWISMYFICPLWENCQNCTCYVAPYTNVWQLAWQGAPRATEWERSCR